MGKNGFLSRCLLLFAQDYKRMQQERASCVTYIDNIVKNKEGNFHAWQRAIFLP